MPLYFVLDPPPVAHRIQYFPVLSLMCACGLLPLPSIVYYQVCLCVCVCVCVRVHACVHVCACAVRVLYALYFCGV